MQPLAEPLRGTASCVTRARAAQAPQRAEVRARGPSAAVSGAGVLASSAAHLCTESWYARMWRGVTGHRDRRKSPLRRSSKRARVGRRRTLLHAPPLAGTAYRASTRQHRTPDSKAHPSRPRRNPARAGTAHRASMRSNATCTNLQCLSIVRAGSRESALRISLAPGVPASSAFSRFRTYLSIRLGGSSGSFGSITASTSTGPSCASA